MLFQLWYYNLLRLIPETITMVALGTGLVKEKYNLKQISLAGAVIGVISFLLQQFPIKYGVHIPIGIIIFMLALNLLLKLNILKSAAAALLSFIVLVFTEWLAVMLQTRLLGYSEEQILGGSDPFKLLLSMPPLLIFIVLALIVQWRLHSNTGRANDRSKKFV